jgi:hypothetical protein
MFFNEHPVKVYRKTQPVGTTWGDPTRKLVGTYFFTIQPFTGDDTFANDQNFSNVRDQLDHINPELDIRADDELEYFGSVHYVAYIQPHRSGVIPHLEVFTADTQIVR